MVKSRNPFNTGSKRDEVAKESSIDFPPCKYIQSSITVAYMGTAARDLMEQEEEEEDEEEEDRDDEEELSKRTVRNGVGHEESMHRCRICAKDLQVGPHDAGTTATSIFGEDGTRRSLQKLIHKYLNITVRIAHLLFSKTFHYFNATVFTLSELNKFKLLKARELSASGSRGFFEKARSHEFKSGSR